MIGWSGLLLFIVNLNNFSAISGLFIGGKARELIGENPQLYVVFWNCKHNGCVTGLEEKFEDIKGVK